MKLNREQSRAELNGRELNREEVGQTYVGNYIGKNYIGIEGGGTIIRSEVHLQLLVEMVFRAPHQGRRFTRETR